MSTENVETDVISPEQPPAISARVKQWMDWRGVGAAGVLALVVGGILFWRSHHHAAASVPTEHGEAAAGSAAAHTVAAARVVREDLYNELAIPAEFRPYEEVELHAKVSGYVDKIDVDFGDRVKSGQLLAQLEVPELKDELDGARATQQRAEADYRGAHLIYMRLLSVQQANPTLVAQQDLDAAEAKDSSTKAAIAVAKADVNKYETLLSYTRITAPFDGVVTHRYADPGSLIQAGTASDTQSLPLVRLSDNYRLRLDFPVSIANIQDIHVGDEVEVKVDSINRTFMGKITRTTQKANEDTRTMMTEVEVPNPNLELVPGIYASVMIKADKHSQALAIPIQAVPPGQTATVYVINSQNEIEERQVKLGIDTPDYYEVVSGLKEGEWVLLGSRSTVKVGEKVQPKPSSSLARE